MIELFYFYIVSGIVFLIVLRVYLLRFIIDCCRVFINVFIISRGKGG